MFLHHKQTIDKVINHFKDEDYFVALIVGGSIAHGYATQNSDVDVLIVVTEEEYQKRLKSKKTHYWNPELADYEHGYVDGKFISINYIKKVIEKGSEPSRFALKDAIVAYTVDDEIIGLIRKAANYPVEEKEMKIKRFYAQFQGWSWFYFEGQRKNNKYLMNTAISNLILYGCRLVLACNEILYPYHKWLLKEVEQAKDKPSNILVYIDNLLNNNTDENIKNYLNCIEEYIRIHFNVESIIWTNLFIADVETTWLNGEVFVGDL